METKFLITDFKENKELKVGFIGTGKAATALAAYFYKSDIMISGFFGRNSAKAESLAKSFNSKSFASSKELIESSDLVILAINDSSIKILADSISLIQGIEWPKKTFFHLSGALPSSSLASLAEKGSNIASFHIIQSLNGDAEKYLNGNALENSWFSIEGTPQCIELATSLLSITDNQYIILTPESKPIYHAAMCMFSNYLVTLMGESCKMLESIGIDFDSAWKLATPLINGTLNNIESFGPEKAMTGPISRGDDATLEAHYLAIENSAPELLDFYKSMALFTKKFLKR